jgi:CheY-like chemotaxis protein/anti-sigma regulatory factor (Ser/Thr protein kinase)
VSRGRIELELEALGLEEVLREALEESLPLLGEREHSATIEIAQPLTVRGDRVRLTQIFGNLINNAAKYTPPQGTVKLSASQDGDYAVVQVQDNGIGIASDMLAKIFDLFVQVQTSIDKARGGLGIGLTLVRTLVELHGGRIEAASEGTGRGTTMKLWLPLARPLESGAQSSAAGRLNRRNSRVLVVDDNEDAADCIAELLRVMGPTVQVAYDARQALEFGRQHQFDLILLDIGLPGMDGYEVARRLRSEKRQCAAQIVALTGFGADRLQAPCFDDWLIKPICIEALQDLLDRV